MNLGTKAGTTKDVYRVGSHGMKIGIFLGGVRRSGMRQDQRMWDMLLDNIEHIYPTYIYIYRICEMGGILQSNNNIMISNAHILC